jgi:hypothetical protein
VGGALDRGRRVAARPHPRAALRPDCIEAEDAADHAAVTIRSATSTKNLPLINPPSQKSVNCVRRTAWRLRLNRATPYPPFGGAHPERPLSLRRVQKTKRARKQRHWHSAAAVDGRPVARLKVTASARRLRALMEVLGFEGRGAQTRFAEEIGVARSRLNNVLIGQPLSRKLAEKIIHRYPIVSADFLFLGQSGGHLDAKLEKQLLEYQQSTGISVFDS